MKFTMRLGKGLKFKSRFGSWQVPMNEAAKEWIVIKLGRWCEEEMRMYLEILAQLDRLDPEARLRNQPYDLDALPF